MNLWNIRSEVAITTEDAPAQIVVGFMNIVTWADSSEIAARKISTYLESFGWRLIEIQETTIIDSNFVAENDEFHDTIGRARNTPDAIILGTLHSYKPN